MRSWRNAPRGVRFVHGLAVAMGVMAVSYATLVHVLDYERMRGSFPWITPVVAIGTFVFCALWIVALIGTLVTVSNWRFGSVYWLWITASGLYVLVFGVRLLGFIGPALP